MIADVMRPERAAFEAWAKDHHFSVETEEGDYVDRATRLAASAYRAGMKAGMERAAQVCERMASVVSGPNESDGHYAPMMWCACGIRAEADKPDQSDKGPT